MISGSPHKIKLWLIISCHFIFSACNTSNNSPKADHIILIGVDGMSPNGIVNAATPNLDKLMKNGAYNFHTRAVLPSSSSSNWASMLMGASPMQHGITSNDWERDDHQLIPVATGIEETFPSIFSVIKMQKPDAKTAAIYHWKGLGRLIERSVIDFDFHGETEEVTAEKASEIIIEIKPQFTLIHLDHVDGAGHDHGHKTIQYYQSISRADSLIGKIINATKKAGIFEKTIFIVSADHGGIGYGHGGETMDEVEIPFIISGPGIKKDYNILQATYVFDVASTVAHLMDLKQPQAWIGRPVQGSFEGNEENLSGQNINALASPVILPKAKLYEPPGGFFINEPAIVEIENVNSKAEVRYTTDGTEPTLQSLLYTQPFPLEQSAVVMARAFSEDLNSTITKANFRVIKNDTNNGIQFEYFEKDNLKFIPVLDQLNPLKKGKVYEFRTENIPTRQSDFAIRYKSYFKIEKSGEYRFYTYSDDGSKLFINNKLVVDNDGDHGALERSGKITLEEGLFPIEVQYFNGGGNGWLEVSYKGPGIPKQIIPAEKLFVNTAK
ncbi:hypothetical protein BH23BAC1_BH23BAC1_09750 [soil metagenome]